MHIIDTEIIFYVIVMFFSIKEIINYNTVSPGHQISLDYCIIKILFVLFPFYEMNVIFPVTDHFAESDFEVGLGEGPAIRARQQLHRKMESADFLKSLKWKQNMCDTAHQNSLFHNISMNTNLD